MRFLGPEAASVPLDPRVVGPDLPEPLDQTFLGQLVDGGGIWRRNPHGAVEDLLAVGAVHLNQQVHIPPQHDLAKAALPQVLNIGGLDYSSGGDLVIDSKTLAILETDDYLLRVYRAPQRTPVELAVIFSRDNRKGTHPPELCLQGGGDGIVAKGDVLVDNVPGREGIPCKELTVRTGSQRQYYLYTYKCGDTYTGSFWRQQIMILLNGLLSRNSSGALIRVSTTISNTEDPADARRRSIAMIRAAIPHLDEKLP